MWLSDNRARLLIVSLGALWCVGWVWFALVSTNGLPGILTLQGNSGAFELLTLSVARAPVWQWLVVISMSTWLALYFLLNFAAYLDRDSKAIAAIAWAFSSIKINVIFSILLCANLLSVVLSQNQLNFCLIRSARSVSEYCCCFHWHCRFYYGIRMSFNASYLGLGGRFGGRVGQC